MSPSAVSSETLQPEVWVSRPEVLSTWENRERQIFQEVFRPAPVLTPSEWAARYRVVSQGPQAGLQWDNSKTPYLVEIMDFVGDPWVRRGVVRKSARVGYTEGVIGNLIGYTIDQDPCNIAVLQPSDKEAESYSKEQISPMIEHNPRLKARVGQLNTRRSDSTMTYKEFPGGYLLLLGSASDKNLRRRSIRVALADEIDGMKVEGAEGDPILRFQKRTDDYEDGVLLMGSTPTVSGESRIDREFARSDQRYWHVPCPHCGDLQVLRWGGPGKPYGMKWDRDVYCKGCGVEIDDTSKPCPGCGSEETVSKHLPETAYYLCQHCGERIEEGQKPAMVRAGMWIPTQPDAKLPGWHIDALVSLMVGARWPKIVEEWVEAQDDVEDLKVFMNTVLGEAWEDRGQKVDVGTLESRAEEYVDREGKVVDVPDGVGVLTSFTDVQGSWLEILVRGWGVGEESWDIFHERIYGDPESASTWARLEAILTQGFRHVNGSTLRIQASLIDAGDMTDTVYSFVKPRERRKIFASLGDKTGSPDHVPLRPPTRANAAGVRVFTIGTYKMKDRLFRWLRHEKPGPRYIHLRAANMDRCNGFDAEYFKQFEAEKKIPKKVKGRKGMRWTFHQTRKRNESIDLHVGNMAALLVLGASVRNNMEAWVESARRPVGGQEDSEKKPTKPTKGEARRRRSGGWASGWK